MAFTAQAQAATYFSFYNGNDLLANSEAVFQGYVVGIVDSLQKAGSSSVCMPARVTVGQVTAVAKKYLNDHPEDLHYSAAGLVTYALQKAFPCK